MSVTKIAIDFFLFLVSMQYSIKEVLKHIFFRILDHKGVGCCEACKTPKYELYKSREVGVINREGAFVRINTGHFRFEKFVLFSKSLPSSCKFHIQWGISHYNLLTLAVLYFDHSKLYSLPFPH